MSTRIDNYEDQIYELKQEIKRLKKEIRLYDCIEKWGTKECRCGFRFLGGDFCSDAEERINKLQEENKNLIKEFRLFWNDSEKAGNINSLRGKPFEYWFNLERKIELATNIFQFILDQWSLDTKNTQDKVLKFFESEEKCVTTLKR